MGHRAPRRRGTAHENRAGRGWRRGAAMWPRARDGYGARWWQRVRMATMDTHSRQTGHACHHRHGTSLSHLVPPFYSLNGKQVSRLSGRGWCSEPRLSGAKWHGTHHPSMALSTQRGALGRYSQDTVRQLSSRMDRQPQQSRGYIVKRLTQKYNFAPTDEYKQKLKK